MIVVYNGRKTTNKWNVKWSKVQLILKKFYGCINKNKNVCLYVLVFISLASNAQNKLYIIYLHIQIRSLSLLNLYDFSKDDHIIFCKDYFQKLYLINKL